MFYFGGSCLCVTSPHPPPSTPITAVHQGPRQESITLGHLAFRFLSGRTERTEPAEVCRQLSNGVHVFEMSLFQLLHTSFPFCSFTAGTDLQVLKAAAKQISLEIQAQSRDPVIIFIAFFFILTALKLQFLLNRQRKQLYFCISK